jgi:hypothetical protein
MVMTWIRNGFLFLAFSLLMAHSVIPHQHLDSDIATFSSTQTSEIRLFDLIRVVLSEDLGTNHLEDYQNSNSSDLVGGVAIIASSDPSFPVVNDACLYTDIRDSFFGFNSILAPDQTRGSPALS